MLHITDPWPSTGRQTGWPHKQVAGILLYYTLNTKYLKEINVYIILKINTTYNRPLTTYRKKKRMTPHLSCRYGTLVYCKYNIFFQNKANFVAELILHITDTWPLQGDKQGGSINKLQVYYYTILLIQNIKKLMYILFCTNNPNTQSNNCIPTFWLLQNYWTIQFILLKPLKSNF